MAYRAAAACKEESVTAALFTVDSIVVDALLHCDHDDVFYDKWKLFLTGSNNFRKQVATTAPYKGNRTAPKPEHLPDVRKHLVDRWGAIIVDGQEADDAIATEATKHGNACIIISIDKDFRQVPGHHYNFVKREHFYVTPENGLRFLYMQILMGDTADNIIGISGIGPKRAEALLKDYTEEIDMYNACIEAYDGNEERVVENARLLYLRRKENELWLPPNKRHLPTSSSKKASRSRKKSGTNTTPTNPDTDS